MRKPPDPLWVFCPTCRALEREPCLDVATRAPLVLPGTRGALHPIAHDARVEAWLALVNPPPPEGEFSLAEGQALLRAWKARRTVGLATHEEQAVRDWMWKHGERIFRRLGDAEGLALQVQSRDSTIQGLLATLADTEARLPGITAKPR